MDLVSLLTSTIKGKWKEKADNTSSTWKHNFWKWPLAVSWALDHIGIDLYKEDILQEQQQVFYFINNTSGTQFPPLITLHLLFFFQLLDGPHVFGKTVGPGTLQPGLCRLWLAALSGGPKGDHQGKDLAKSDHLKWTNCQKGQKDKGKFQKPSPEKKGENFKVGVND